jgi:hypothetical protein
MTQTSSPPADHHRDDLDRPSASSPIPTPSSAAQAVRRIIHTRTRPPELSTAAPVSYVELVFGAAALLGWFVLFGGAILIGTEPYRKVIANLDTTQHLFRSSLIVLAFWTITNVGLLCCLSSCLGALGRRTRFAVRIGAPAHRTDMVPRPVLLHYVSAVIRGFSIYGIVMAGLLVLATESFITPTQGEYVRLAATMSVMSFYAGYDPGALASLLHRVRKLFEAGGLEDEQAHHH